MQPLVERPLGAMTLGYVAGLLLGNWLALLAGVGLALGIAGLALMVPLMSRGWPQITLLYVVGLFALLGVLAGGLVLSPHLAANHIKNFLTYEKMNVEGRLVSALEPRLGRTGMVVEAERLHQRDGFLPVTGKILLSVAGRLEGLNYGDRVRFLARLSRPENFQNPGAYDYQRSLAREGIWVRVSISDPEDIVFLGQGQVSFFKRWLERTRLSVRQFISQRVQPREAGLLKAWVLGEKGEIPPEIRRAFSRTGVAHVLALSGLHIGIVGGLAYFLFRHLLRLFPAIILRLGVRLPASLLALVPVTLYSLLAGAAGFSLLRAFLMAVAVIIFLLLGRLRDPLDAITFAAFLILILFPGALFSISFQLSFAAVLAMYWLIPPMNRWLKLEERKKRWRRAAQYILASLAVTVAASLGTAPLTAYYFNLATPVGFVSNLVVVPWVGLAIVPLSLLALGALAFSSIGGGWLLGLAAFLSQGLIRIVDFFASVPWGYFLVVPPDKWQVVVLFAGIFFLGYALQGRRWARAVLAGSAAIMVGPFFFSGLARDRSNLEVVFLDVKQGDATLVRFPGGQTMLIDAGGFRDPGFDVGERVVAPFLLKKGIRKLDYLVGTHDDLDHSGGIPYLLNYFAVKEFWADLTSWDKATKERIIGLVSRRGINYVRATESNPPLVIGQATVSVLNPASNYPEGQPREPAWQNNRSVVIKVTYGQASFLFTADIEAQGEERLLASGRELLARVLKVPHHGSGSSSTARFLEDVKPWLAVISVGAGNPAGLPSQRAIESYQGRRIRVLRTDQQGAIIVTSDGRITKVRTHLGQEKWLFDPSRSQ